MQLSKEAQKFLDEIGLKYIETILDRRGTLALRVSRDGKRAVLKLQSDDGSEEAGHKAKLLVGEAEILSQIPHLTNHLYMDHGNSNGRHWLLIREIDGQEIDHVAKQARETISNQKERVVCLAKLLIRVSGFYNELYANGYLHGDVQPAHTYLERDEITVIDWGLARKVDEPNPLYKGGFVYFVAPEIAECMQKNETSIEYTVRSEVYAIGITLFMFYTGSLALDFGIPKADLRQTSMEQKLQRVIENHIFSFKELGSDEYPELEAILRKCLSINPSNRFETPSVLHKYLSELGMS